MYGSSPSRRTTSRGGTTSSPRRLSVTSSMPRTSVLYAAIPASAEDGPLSTKPPLAPVGTITTFFSRCAFISPRISVRKSSRRSDQRMPPRATGPARRWQPSIRAECTQISRHGRGSGMSPAAALSSLSARCSFSWKKFVRSTASSIRRRRASTRSASGSATRSRSASHSASSPAVSRAPPLSGWAGSKRARKRATSSRAASGASASAAATLSGGSAKPTCFSQRAMARSSHASRQRSPASRTRRLNASGSARPASSASSASTTASPRDGSKATGASSWKTCSATRAPSPGARRCSTSSTARRPRLSNSGSASARSIESRGSASLIRTRRGAAPGGAESSAAGRPSRSARSASAMSPAASAAGTVSL